MQEKRNIIPLAELYEPIQKLNDQINTFNQVIEGVDYLKKERMKKQWIIDTVFDFQMKQKLLIKDKDEIDLIYKKASLSQEQSNILINEDFPIDEKFFLAFSIIKEQELLQQNITSYSNSDNPDENNPPLRKSLMKNIEEIKQLAFSKILKKLFSNYQDITAETIKQLYQIVNENQQSKARIIELIEYHQKQEFSLALSSYIIQIEGYKEDNVLSNLSNCFHELKEQTLVQYKKLSVIFSDDELQLKLSIANIVDEPASNFLNKIERALVSVQDYFQMYEIMKQINVLSKSFECGEFTVTKFEKLTYQAMIQKLKGQTQTLLQKTLQFLYHSLQNIRYNIGLLSALDPIEDFFKKSINLIKGCQENQIIQATETLFQLIWNLVLWKLKHKEENRSSKIFSLNALEILQLNYIKLQEILKGTLEGEVKESFENHIHNNIQKIEELKDQLIKKLQKENVEDIEVKLKMEQINLKKMNPNNEKEVKDITRKIFVVLIKLESEIKKKELFFEMEFIRSQDIRMKSQLGAVDLFMSEYEQIYDVFVKYSKKIGVEEFNEEGISKLIQHFSITNREAPRKDYVKIYDPQIERINFINIIGI